MASNVTGTHTDTALRSTDTIYIDWAVLNDGGAATTATFYTALYVDGVFRAYWFSSPPLNPNFFAFVNDYPIGSLSAGTHTLTLSTDFSNAIRENSETDNSYTKTITVN